MSLKEFLITLEGKACNGSVNELYFVDQFLDVVRDEKKDVRWLLTDFYSTWTEEALCVYLINY